MVIPCSPRRALLAAAIAATLIGTTLIGGVAHAGTVEPATPSTVVADPAPGFRSDRLSVEVLGSGPDVILIPGLASSREVWRPLAMRLSATHRLHLVQLAGFAGEPWTQDDGPFLAPVVEDLARYIREAGLDRPAVIGHSLGGLSGLMLAQARPAAVGRLMIVDALPFYSAMFGPGVTAEAARPFADQATAMVLAADDAAFAAQQARTAAAMARDPATREAMTRWSIATDRRAMAAALREVMTTDARPGLAAMMTPVTVLYAADADGGASAEGADALWAREYAALPGITLIRVDDSRHFIMADQPQRFEALVEAFLD